jgi:hypothetical protein
MKRYNQAITNGKVGGAGSSGKGKDSVLQNVNNSPLAEQRI